MPLLVPEVCVPTSSSRPPPTPFAKANPPRPTTENAAEPKINPRLLIRFNLFSLIASSTIARFADKQISCSQQRGQDKSGQEDKQPRARKASPCLRARTPPETRLSKPFADVSSSPARPPKAILWTISTPSPASQPPS